MKTRLSIAAFSLLSVGVLVLAALIGKPAGVGAQKPQVRANDNAQVYPTQTEVQPSRNSNVRVEPEPQTKLAPNPRAGAAQSPGGSRTRGFFRVTLNGFKVNHESDDDILEGDGRGDEIYITTNLWTLHRDGTYQAYRQSRTASLNRTFKALGTSILSSRLHGTQ
jgi:hypothetical protein